MKKPTLITLLTLLLMSSQVIAQQFDPAADEYQKKLESYIGRYGTPERVYLTDAKNKTFAATGGQTYLVAFVYDIDSKSTRRMMVYELDENGGKLHPRYPDYTQGFRGSAGKQMFHVRIDASGDNTQQTLFKIDTNADATVYIYRLKRGVKH